MNYRLLKGLRKYKNVELYAILLNEGKVADEFRKLGVSVNVVDETHLNFYQIFRTTEMLIRDISPDVLHSHRLKENILAHFSANYRNNIKLICTQHGMPEPTNGIFKFLKRYILRRYHFKILSNHFRKVVVVSEDIRNHFVHDYGFCSDIIEMIHNGTDIPKQNTLINKDDCFTIGSAGRLFPVKDYKLLVEIAREVLRQENNIIFELAGEGPEKDNILALIHEYGMERRFVLSGFIDDISRFYKKIDLYINTSLHEGLPMSILEAMAYGLPVIAPNVGGLKEIIENGLHGYLIDNRDPKNFADACIRFYRDREILQYMGNAAREKIENELSSDIMASKYYYLYNNM